MVIEIHADSPLSPWRAEVATDATGKVITYAGLMHFRFPSGDWKLWVQDGKSWRIFPGDKTLREVIENPPTPVILRMTIDDRDND